MELSRHLRQRSTESERKAWEMLRCRRCGGMKFRRQHPLGRYVVDFYCAELQLVIELDGAVHEEAGRANVDAIRTGELEAMGLTVIRVANDAVDRDSLTRIVISHQTPPLRASAWRGGGG